MNTPHTCDGGAQMSCTRPVVWQMRTANASRAIDGFWYFACKGHLHSVASELVNADTNALDLHYIADR